MNLKKLALVLVVVLMASTLAPVLAKSPFADVPADHWAYDSVVELAAAGLIEGYPDGTFGGSRMMTRYEAAMVFARALSRLESQIGNIDVLPELDKIKADLMDEIKAQLAALDKPVVETKVIEKVIVDKDVDEETLARIRATEIAAEALEGDIAYVENRVLGLMDGIRYDVNKLQEQMDEPGVEVPSMDEIEALIAEKVEAGILEAALSAKEVVKETTIVEKAVMVTPEVTEEDVEAIAEALILTQLQKYDIILNEHREHILGIYERLDVVEADQAELKTVVKDAVKELERVKLSGDLTLKGEYGKDGAKEYAFTQNGSLNLNVKASDTVNVKAFLGFDIEAGELGDKLTNYGVEVTSESPITRLVVGKVNKDDVRARFNSYVLEKNEYAFAGLADLEIIDGLKANVLLGQETVGSDEPVAAALGLEYKLMPELGLKVAGVAGKAPSDKPEFKAAGAGLFGEIANIEYTGDFAIDLGQEADEDNKLANTLFAATLKTKISDITLDGSFVTKGVDYAVANPFVGAAKYSFELGAAAEFIGINLGGRYYSQVVDPDLADQTKISAYKLDASKEFDVFVPVTISARFAGNNTNEADESKTNLFAQLAVKQEADLGLQYGASAAYEKNVLTDVKWKEVGKYTGNDNATFKANVGYKFDWRDALVDLGYGATFVLPVEEDTERASELTHKVDFGYGFTENVKFTLGGTVGQKFEKVDTETVTTNDFGYNAGLTVKF